MNARNLRGDYTLTIRGISQEAGIEAMEHLAGGAVALYNGKCYPLDDDKPWELRAALPEQPLIRKWREEIKELKRKRDLAFQGGNEYGVTQYENKIKQAESMLADLDAQHDNAPVATTRFGRVGNEVATD